MNINVNAAASIAGTSRAAAKGGESDSQATETSRQQSAAESPTGKASDSSAIDAGDHTSDRGGNGQQVLDVFEHHEDENGEESQPDSDEASAGSDITGDGLGSHLDLQA